MWENALRAYGAEKSNEEFPEPIWAFENFESMVESAFGDRVIVDSDQVNDREAAKMCKDIAKAIEETLTYPGEIRVTVMRESRTVEYAR